MEIQTGVGKSEATGLRNVGDSAPDILRLEGVDILPIKAASGSRSNRSALPRSLQIAPCFIQQRNKRRCTDDGGEDGKRQLDNADAAGQGIDRIIKLAPRLRLRGTT